MLIKFYAKFRQFWEATASFVNLATSLPIARCRLWFILLTPRCCQRSLYYCIHQPLRFVFLHVCDNVWACVNVFMFHWRVHSYVRVCAICTNTCVCTLCVSLWLCIYDCNK